MKMPIPSDWDGTGFCDYVVNWPDSLGWLQILKGLLTNPSLEQFWDERTGDVPEIIADFQPTLNPNLDELECDIMKIPIGTVVAFAGEYAPDSWLLCDGSSYLAVDYPDLFGLIGRFYGGSSSEGTFWVPNLKGKVPVGFDNSQAEFDHLGETGGAKTHTLTTSEMPAHSHSDDRGATWGTPWVNSAALYALGNLANTTGALSKTQTGGGLAHNNLQPYIALNYIIKAE